MSKRKKGKNAGRRPVRRTKKPTVEWRLHCVAPGGRFDPLDAVRVWFVSTQGLVVGCEVAPFDDPTGAARAVRAALHDPIPGAPTDSPSVLLAPDQQSARAVMQLKPRFMIRVSDDLEGWVELGEPPDDDEFDDDWPAPVSSEPQMERVHEIAADVFGYSLYHYADRLENPRFGRLMPDDVRLLQQARKDGWSVDQVARRLERDEEVAERMMRLFEDADAVVQAPTPAAGYLLAVQKTIRRVVPELSDERVTELAGQIGYATADLAYRLDRDGSRLSDFRDTLRFELE